MAQLVYEDTGEPVPESDQIQQSQPQQPQGGQLVYEDTGQAVPSSDLPEGSVTDVSTPAQQAIGYGEALGRGLAGPIFTGAEKLLGVPAENMAARQEYLGAGASATEAASFVGSMFLGTGEAAALAKVGEAAASAAKATGAAATFLKGAVESGLFLGGDKISKSIMGTEDPNETASSALLQVGGTALLGGGGSVAFERLAGPVLAKIGESKIGTKVSQFMSDLGSALEFEHANPDIVEATSKQMNDLVGANESARDEIYGSGGLKAQNIARLTEDVSQEQLDKHIGDVGNMFSNAPRALQESPAFQDIRDEFLSKVTPEIDPISLQPKRPPASAADVFQATDLAKQRINNEIAKFGARTGDKFLQNTAQRFYGALADTLEDSSVWNQAGDFQKQLNAAVSDFIPKNNDFLKRFTENFSSSPEEDAASKIIKPGAVKTYLNQMGEAAGQNKRLFVQRWAEASEQYQQQINAIHEAFGVQSPMSTPPTDLIKRSYGELSPGSQAARSIYQFGFKRAAQSTLGTIWGGEEGYRRGGVTGAVVGGIGGGIAGAIAPHFENLVVGGLRKYGVPVIVRAMNSGAPEATGAMLNYAASAAKGASKLTTGINSLFEYGGTKAVEAVASEADKNKIDDFVKNNDFNRQLEAQVTQPTVTQPVQHFSEGGAVQKPEPQPIPENQAPPVLKSVKGIAKAMPEHAAILAGAKSRIANYLNSVRPQQNSPKLAFDSEPPKSEKERSYQKALELAASPLGILNHIKGGTLTPETLNHFKSMWPELHHHISKEITGKITEAQLNGEVPPYRTRQSMSLFLGSPLDSTMTPQAIQMIQSVYAPRPVAPAAGAKPKAQKKNKSTLGDLPKDHYTQDQASAGRATAWD